MLKNIIYIFGITILGIGIGFVILARVGYGPWDIFYANLVELFSSNFTIMQGVVSFILVMFGYILRKMKPDLSIIIITVNSAYIAVWIDIMLRFNSPTNTIVGYGMLIGGLLLIAIGVNIARYTRLVLPALDFFIQSIEMRTHLSYGRIKQIIEVVVFVLGVGLGLLFDLTLKIGIGTLIIMFAGGYFINLTHSPMIKIMSKLFGKNS